MSQGPERSSKKWDAEVALAHQLNHADHDPKSIIVRVLELWNG